MNKKGFILLEVLVGLVFLAIGLLAIAGMQLTSVRGNFFSSNMTQGSIFAQERQGYSNPHLRMGSGQNEIVEGDILK